MRLRLSGALTILSRTTNNQEVPVTEQDQAPVEEAQPQEEVAAPIEEDPQDTAPVEVAVAPPIQAPAPPPQPIPFRSSFELSTTAFGESLARVRQGKEELAAAKRIASSAELAMAAAAAAVTVAEIALDTSRADSKVDAGNLQTLLEIYQQEG